ncbi:hypothetical protein K440DRAFT_639433 [Wilcoxina mikolae CBS 423.85]|nr:hypothetical protein K440DRAFT_639433 [Wilcoxina mikolae CBS 423.85]
MALPPSSELSGQTTISGNTPQGRGAGAYCDLCKKHFGTKQDLTQHIHTQHTQMSTTHQKQVENQSLPSKDCSCYVCDRYLPTENILRVHQASRSHQNNLFNLMPRMNHSGQFSCIQDNFLWKTESTFRLHLASDMHLWTGRPNCPRCRRLFRTMKELFQHSIQVHKWGEQPYCDVCKCHFIEPMALAQHMASEGHNTTRFGCSYDDEYTPLETLLEVDLTSRYTVLTIGTSKLITLDQLRGAIDTSFHIRPITDRGAMNVRGENMLISGETGRCAFCARVGHSYWDCNSPYNDMALAGPITGSTFGAAGRQGVAAVSSSLAVKPENDEGNDRGLNICGSSEPASVEYFHQHARNEISGLFQKCPEDNIDAPENTSEIIGTPAALKSEPALGNLKALTKEDKKAMREEGLSAYISLQDNRNKDAFEQLRRSVASNAGEEVNATVTMPASSFLDGEDSSASTESESCECAVCFQLFEDNADHVQHLVAACKMGYGDCNTENMLLSSLKPTSPPDLLASLKSS